MKDEENHAPPTSVDVARRAGVSQSAVSLVFGGKGTGRVGQKTQDAILRAAQELGYHPNSAARTLRLGRTRRIALAVPDVSNPYFAAVLQGAEQAARTYGYTVMLMSIRDEHDWQSVVIDTLTSQAVDGFLFCTLQPPTSKEQAALQGKAVLVDAFCSGLPALQLNVEAGMHSAMAHLMRLGHTKIAHLAAAVEAESFHLRHQAYLAALQLAKLPLIEDYQASAPFTIDAARDAVRKILACADPPTAFVCDSDVLAVGTYKAAKDLQRAIPADLSVVSFDDSVIAHILDPELTTVALPARSIGEQALLLLLKVLEKKGLSTQVAVPLELVIRASTAQVKAR